VTAMAVTFVAGLLLLGSTAFAADPPGNNGTVKIDRNEPFDDDPNNEPHVTCPFQIDLYGFDEGDFKATITLLAHNPTQRPDGEDQHVADDVTLFIGGDPAGGGTDLDASQTYDAGTLDFSGIEPQENQGFHVKATIHAEGSQGADVKHKVFWVQPCEGQGGSSTSSSTTSTTTPGGGGKSEQSTTTSSTILGAAAGKGVLPFSGSNSLPLLVAGLAMLGLGAASVLITRRRQRGAAR
jgi:hypothetical protein